MRLSDGEVLFLWPLTQHLITAGWTYNNGAAHNAIDLRAAPGTPVFAAEDGTVTLTQDWNDSKTGMQSYGNGVLIKHANYKSLPLATRYAHLTSRCVNTGDSVKEGQVIGYSGETGNCIGAHLHFEVICNGQRVNPLNWLDDDFTCKDDKVKAHLGRYTSVVKPVSGRPTNDTPEQEKPVTEPGNAATNGIRLQRVRCTMRNSHDGKEMGAMLAMMGVPIIAEVTDGDALAIMRKCTELCGEYTSEYFYL